MRIFARLPFVLFLILACPASAQDLASRTVLDGRVTLLVPAGFERMSQEMLTAKYPRQQPPKLVLTNADGSVNIAFRHTPMPASSDKLPAIHAMVEQALEQQFPTAEWRSSEISERDGMRFFKLDFMTPAIDTDIRNIMFGTPLDGRMLLISFNCTRELDARWAPYGHRIINSITVARP